jgi:hypothetical protein
LGGGERVSRGGAGDWGGRLEDAIAAGATSTEILFALRWHLRALSSMLARPLPETARPCKTCWRRSSALRG